MFFVFERAVLEATRARIRANLQIRPQQCDLEVGDDILPATAEDMYYAIIPAGVSPGEHHRSGGTLWDVRVSVKVTLFRKVSSIPRDRRRDSVFDALHTSMTTELDEIIRLLDRDQTLRTAVQSKLIDTPAEQGRVVEPFRSVLPDRVPRAIVSDPYAAATGASEGDPILALARGVIFQDIRFMLGQ